MFLIRYWRQIHVFKHSDLSYAIEFINFIITLNFAINSLISFPCQLSIWRSERRQFLPLLLFCLYHLTLFTLSQLLSLSSLSHIRVLPTNIIALSLRIHVPAMSIIVTLSLRSQVLSHLCYHFFKTSYITSVCIPYPQHCNINRMFIIIIIICLHGLGHLTCSGIDALPSFPGAPTISSSTRFVVQGVFQKSGVVHSFRMVDPVLFVFGSHVLYSRDL